MAPEPASRRRSDDTHMKLVCSHGGRFFLPCGHDGEPRHVGGETRVLVVPRGVSFQDLEARLAEMVSGGGGSVSADQVRAIRIRHRLADEGLEDVLVTVTCDEEVAHMRDEYDCLRATRPAVRFRVFVTVAAASSAAGGPNPKRATTTTRRVGLPPLPPRSSMRRVQSDQAVVARAQQHQHRPTRRVHSAPELVGGVHMQMQPPSFHQHLQRCCSYSSCQRRRDRYTTAPPARASDVRATLHVQESGRVAAVSTEAAAAREKATNRDVEAAMEKENTRAIWELE